MNRLDRIEADNAVGAKLVGADNLGIEDVRLLIDAARYMLSPNQSYAEWQRLRDALLAEETEE